jgi:3'-phosphoadenosine 5'-phosphosulfate sulfotransferase (PAPS reductase)/FAD synthetase
MKYILNFGAGVNSTALLIELVKRKEPLDYVIFADTGSEIPETYNCVKMMKEWCEEHNIRFIQVESIYRKSLYQYYFDKKTIPWRKFRDCTDKFKKSPITKFLNQFKAEGVTQYIGIGSDEVYRIKQSQVKWITFRYPLAEWKIDRAKCVKIIEREGLVVPPKSGCFCCPFQSKETWIKLLKEKPDYFKKARVLEEQNLSYPDNTLTFSYSLKQYEKAVKEQQPLNQFWENPSDICDGMCMT